jgi:hypothetical protein
MMSLFCILSLFSLFSFTFVELLAVEYEFCNYICNSTLSAVVKYELTAYVHNYFNCILAISTAFLVVFTVLYTLMSYENA